MTVKELILKLTELGTTFMDKQVTTYEMEANNTVPIEGISVIDNGNEIWLQSAWDIEESQ